MPCRRSVLGKGVRGVYRVCCLREGKVSTESWSKEGKTNEGENDIKGGKNTN